MSKKAAEMALLEECEKLLTESNIWPEEVDKEEIDETKTPKLKEGDPVKLIDGSTGTVYSIDWENNKIKVVTGSGMRTMNSIKFATKIDEAVKEDLRGDRKKWARVEKPWPRTPVGHGFHIGQQVEFSKGLTGVVCGAHGQYDIEIHSLEHGVETEDVYRVPYMNIFPVDSVVKNDTRELPESLKSAVDKKLAEGYGYKDEDTMEDDSPWKPEPKRDETKAKTAPQPKKKEEAPSIKRREFDDDGEYEDVEAVAGNQLKKKGLGESKESRELGKIAADAGLPKDPYADEYEDEDEADQSITIKLGNAVVEMHKEGSHWVEGRVLEGKAPYGWGGKRYMSYLTPDDIIQWLNKDYGRSIRGTAELIEEALKVDSKELEDLKTEYKKIVQKIDAIPHKYSSKTTGPLSQYKKLKSMAATIKQKISDVESKHQNWDKLKMEGATMKEWYGLNNIERLAQNEEWHSAIDYLVAAILELQEAVDKIHEASPMTAKVKEGWKKTHQIHKKDSKHHKDNVGKQAQTKITPSEKEKAEIRKMFNNDYSISNPNFGPNKVWGTADADGEEYNVTYTYEELKQMGMIKEGKDIKIGRYVAHKEVIDRIAQEVGIPANGVVSILKASNSGYYDDIKWETGYHDDITDKVCNLWEQTPDSEKRSRENERAENNEHDLVDESMKEGMHLSQSRRAEILAADNAMKKSLETEPAEPKKETDDEPIEENDMDKKIDERLQYLYEEDRGEEVDPIKAADEIDAEKLGGVNTDLDMPSEGDEGSIEGEEGAEMPAEDPTMDNAGGLDTDVSSEMQQPQTADIPLVGASNPEAAGDPLIPNPADPASMDSFYQRIGTTFHGVAGKNGKELYYQSWTFANVEDATACSDYVKNLLGSGNWKVKVSDKECRLLWW